MTIFAFSNETPGWNRSAHRDNDSSIREDGVVAQILSNPLLGEHHQACGVWEVYSDSDMMTRMSSFIDGHGMTVCLKQIEIRSLRLWRLR